MEHAAKGILTARAERCHAAVVARGMGRPCVLAQAKLRSIMKINL